MRLGIDLGGTKTEIVALADDGAELLRERVSTPRGDYAATVATIASLVVLAEAKVGSGGTVGVGIPGAESRVTGLVKNANSTWLIGRPLRTDLETALGRPVRLANDANCFALSEAVDGAAAGAEVVFGVILGTGVGGGIVVKGEVLVGANAIAGEWGHNRMPDENEDRPCYCGRRDCIETWLSGPALAADGGADDEAALQRYERRLARALAQVINLLDPDVIVLGGGVSNLDRLYDRVPRLWGEWVFSDHVATRLLKNKHGDSSGVRGAAWLWNT
ncbi:MAG: fructokinase [Pseudomonadota bacterium]|nr:fructokinase [Pseudomonadota bacterium]